MWQLRAGSAGWLQAIRESFLEVVTFQQDYKHGGLGGGRVTPSPGRALGESL